MKACPHERFFLGEYRVQQILAAAIRAGKAKVPDAFVISDEAGRALDMVPLVEALPEFLRK